MSIRNDKTVEMKLINTLEEKPPYNESVLFWHPAGKGHWAIGILYQGVDEYGDYFSAYGGGWYLCDGHTYWASLPKNPKTE